MANNCLVTKLKESVANNNLSKLGVLRIHFVQSQINNPAFYVQFTAAEDSSMVGKKAQVYTEAGVFVKEITLGYAGSISNKQMDGVTVPGYIEIPDKYLITMLNLGNYPECNVKFSEVTYIPITSNLVFKGADVDSHLSQLPKTVSDINIDNSFLERGVSGSLADIVNFTDTKCFYFTNTNIKGDLVDLQGKTTINELGLRNTNNCGGDIKLFFDAQFANGKTSGTTRVTVDSTGFYYDGVMFTGTKTATFTSEGYTVA